MENEEEDKRVVDVYVHQEDEKDEKAGEEKPRSDFKADAETKSFTDWLEKQDLAVKILFALPFLDIVWGIYRIFKGLQSGDAMKLVIAILTIFPLGFIMWLVDLIWIVSKGNGFWL